MPPKTKDKDEALWTHYLSQILFAHGDVPCPLAETVRTLDSITTDYIIQICFGAAQKAALHNRAKVKVDDVLFALRDNPAALGKIEEMQEKDKMIKATRKAVTDDTENLNTMAEVGKGEGVDGEVKKKKGKGGDGGMGAAFSKNLKGAKGAFA